MLVWVVVVEMIAVVVNNRRVEAITVCRTLPLVHKLVREGIAGLALHNI